MAFASEEILEHRPEDPDDLKPGLRPSMNTVASIRAEAVCI